MTEPIDNTRSERPTSVPSVDDAAVSGGGADRLDAPGAGSGGLPGGGADGETAAREQLRKDLGERAPGMDTEDGDDLEQAAAIGETDDPQGGSIQEHGSRP
jgi:hypothetical protein